MGTRRHETSIIAFDIRGPDRADARRRALEEDGVRYTSNRAGRLVPASETVGTLFSGDVWISRLDERPRLAEELQGTSEMAGH